MKEVVGQYTFKVDAGTNGVLFVIPKDKTGQNRPDVVLESNGLSIPHPAITMEQRNQAIIHAQKATKPDSPSC